MGLISNGLSITWLKSRVSSSIGLLCFLPQSQLGNDAAHCRQFYTYVVRNIHAQLHTNQRPRLENVATRTL